MSCGSDTVNRGWTSQTEFYRFPKEYTKRNTVKQSLTFCIEIFREKIPLHTILVHLLTVYYSCINSVIVTVFPTNVRSVTLQIVVFFKSTAILQT